MISVNYPEPQFKFRRENGIEYIFDPIRRQWLILSEEEWVRQNFIQYLVQSLQYPSAFIALEKEIILGELKKRFDILIYDSNHQAWMMVECKAREVSLSDAVVHQVLRYNLSIPVNFLVITNGHYTFAWERAGDELKLIEKMPAWK